MAGFKQISDPETRGNIFSSGATGVILYLEGDDDVDFIDIFFMVFQEGFDDRFSDFGPGETFGSYFWVGHDEVGFDDDISFYWFIQWDCF